MKRKNGGYKNILVWLFVGVVLMLPPLIEAAQHKGGNLWQFMQFGATHGGGRWHWARALGQFTEMWHMSIVSESSRNMPGSVLLWLGAAGIVATIALVCLRPWISMRGVVPRPWILLGVLMSYFVVYAGFFVPLPREYMMATHFIVPMVVACGMAGLIHLARLAGASGFPPLIV